MRPKVAGYWTAELQFALADIDPRSAQTVVAGGLPTDARTGESARSTVTDVGSVVTGVSSRRQVRRARIVIGTGSVAIGAGAVIDCYVQALSGIQSGNLPDVLSASGELIAAESEIRSV